VKIVKGRRTKFAVRSGEPELQCIWFKNFKAFGNWVKIPIKPITIIFGKNSAGKSSIMHAFLWLREISENGFLNIRTTAKSGDFVDLGGLQNYVHADENGRANSIGYKVELLDSYSFLNRELQELFFRAYRRIPSRIDLTNDLDQEKQQIAIDQLIETGAKEKIPPFLRSKNKIEFEVEFALPNEKALEENEDEKIQPLLKLKINNNYFCTLTPKLQIREENNAEASYKDFQYEFNFSDEFLDTILLEVSKIFEIIYPNSYRDSTKPANPMSLKVLMRQVEKYAVWTDWNDNFTGLKIYPSRRLSGRFTDIDQKETDEVGSIEPDIKRFDERLFPILRLLMEEVYLAWVKEILELKKNALGSLLASLNYLPAIRKYPERIISENSISTTYGQEIYGNKALRSLFQSPKLIKELNLACRSLGAKFEFRVVKRYFQVLGKSLIVSNLINKNEISFRDIGFGWSQVFPVLIEILSNDSPFLLIEQPELHLHPTAQSQLMLIIINQIMESKVRQVKAMPLRPGIRKEAGQTILLEAHSEQMVIKLLSCFKRYNIREKDCEVALGPDICAILHVYSDGTSSLIQEIIPDETGNIGNQWPGGFFESAMLDLIKHQDYQKE